MGKGFFESHDIYRAANTAIGKLESGVCFLFDKLAVDIDIAKIIYDHAKFHSLVIFEEVIQKRRFTATEKSGDDRDGDELLVHFSELIWYCSIMTYFSELYHNKKILIWGLGLYGGGAGAARFFCELGARVTVTDMADEVKLAKSLESLRDLPDIRYVLGGHDEADFFESDLIIMNPAIKPSNDLYKRLRDAGKQIETDYSIFLKHFTGLIVGITGTKGKSTLTKMTQELLTRALQTGPITYRGRQYMTVAYGGNIKKSMLDMLLTSNEQTIAVLELSSFMLQQAQEVARSPEIGIITNIYTEHLDWHADLEEYVRAKAHLIDAQDDQGVAIIGEQCEALFAPHIRGTKYIYDGMPDEALTLLAKVLRIDIALVGETVDQYVALEGRSEFVRELNGVRYLNDTMSTHPAAVLFALKTLKRQYEQKGEVFRAVVILGGIDKGFSAEEMQALADFLKENEIKTVIIPGTFGDHLRDYMTPEYVEQWTYPAETMISAVTVASHEAGEGATVILSPGASSFNMFKNANDRGEQFVAAVRDLV